MSFILDSSCENVSRTVVPNERSKRKSNGSVLAASSDLFGNWRIPSFRILVRGMKPGPAYEGPSQGVDFGW